MKLTGLVLPASLCLLFAPMRAADAVAPVDYTQRNPGFAPGATVTPERKSPAPNSSLQEKRVVPPTLDPAKSTAGEQRAPITMEEARTKRVVEKDTHRPEANPITFSPVNGRVAPISTHANDLHPALVAKYQDSLVAASASNLARFPATGGATATKINRFVFRRNPAEPAPSAATAVPAAGGFIPAR
jgi:hypothetical protein